MSEQESGRPNDEEARPLTAVEEIPPLYVSRERLTFQARGKVVHVPLDKLIEAGDGGALGLLLYGVILKLQDLDSSLRTLSGIATEQAARVQHLQGGGAQAIVGDVVKGLRDLGIFPPPIPGAPDPAARGDGKPETRTATRGGRGLA